MLKINGIDAFYGKVQALHNISMEIGDGEIISIIGSNGAGKTTLMNCIMGVVKARNGTIEYRGENITDKKTHMIMRKGIVYIPEGREVFPNMTVLNNLEMGAYSKTFSKKQLNEHLDSMYELFPRLKERAGQKAGSLSGGEQQMLAIARGLMSDPLLLMCDEPSLGLAPVIVDDMFNVLVKVNKMMNIPIIIVEQNAYMALSVSNRCYVLENGLVTASGDSDTLLNSDEIKKAYLGG
ncbi:ABC transporter ATP-binding protein [Caproiciproducens sp. CPB-2]|uniref:ABC transporter ATP-binding protein n=1 Tax=unclassified Caproiciproducens TaxID=2643836 RepID=UPI0023DAA8EA|nr:ABC transporter ATP-binding protein [Caproiciproducens sp. CPB-2]MDF1494760.1 ABC transporter ATP-binding protein [Caproiciproducens sp. CPB-2]